MRSPRLFILLIDYLPSTLNPFGGFRVYPQLQLLAIMYNVTMKCEVCKKKVAKNRLKFCSDKCAKIAPKLRWREVFDVDPKKKYKYQLNQPYNSYYISQ